VSPWAKHGFIDHTQYEFASLLRLAEDNFNLPLLGTRDVKANNMMNSFDFDQSPLQPLIEPANFVGPENPSATTQLMTSSLTTNQVSSPYWGIGFPVEAMIVGLSFGLFFILVKRRRGKMG
jgi:hypothetical protein